VRPFADKTGQQKYEVFRLTDRRVTATFDADNDEEALEQFDRMFPGPDRQRYDVRRAGTAEPQQTEPAAPELVAPETQPDANFAFVNRVNNQVIQWLTRNTRWQAERVLQDAGLAHLYDVVPVRPRTSSTPLPGSTQDLQQRRAAAAEPAERSDQWWDQPTGTSGFTGTWRVMIDGEEVHRFSGVGNIQADALRVGQRWVLDQIRRGQLNPVPGAEVEVVPEMR
jgi:hypothetical protein